MIQKYTGVLMLIVWCVACHKEERIEPNAVFSQGGTVKMRVEQYYPKRIVLLDKTVKFSNGYDQESQELSNYGLARLYDPNGNYFYVTPADCRASIDGKNYGMQEMAPNHIVYYMHYIRYINSLQSSQRTAHYEITVYRDSVKDILNSDKIISGIRTVFYVDCNTIRSK